MYQSKYKIFLPPPEIFLDEYHATYGWDKAADLEPIEKECRFEFPPEGGILYFGPKTIYPFKGVSFPPATDNVAIFKRMILTYLARFKNPLEFFFIKRTIRETDELGNVALRRYYLKPNLYVRCAREVYRIVMLLVNNEYWANNAAMIIQWDTAYRHRWQYIMGFYDKEQMLKHPRKEINRLLDIGIGMENESSAFKWKRVKLLVNILLCFPRFRAMIRKIAEELKKEELVFDKIDIAYAFKKGN
jgi:hypothetical protein